MQEIKVGDIVVRKSYGADITFKVTDKKVTETGEVIYTLKGVSCRLQADAPERDLVYIPYEKLANNV